MFIVTVSFVDIDFIPSDIVLVLVSLLYRLYVLRLYSCVHTSGMPAFILVY